MERFKLYGELLHLRTKVIEMMKVDLKLYGQGLQVAYQISHYSKVIL